MDLINAFAGNLADDPQLRYLSNGTAMLEFVVLVNRDVKNDAGEYEKQPPTRKPVKVFGRTAEHIAESITRGSRVTVIGAEQTRAYTKKDGEQGLFTETVVDGHFGEVGLSLKYAPATSAKASRATVSTEKADTTGQ